MTTIASGSPAPDSPGHEHRFSDEVEELAIAAAGSVSPAQRAQLHERMVLIALPLADRAAKRYAGRGIESDDLTQVARAALVKAVRRYRPGAGSGFAAFATPTIFGELKRAFRDYGWSVRPPRRVQELRPAVAMEEEHLRCVLSREPTEEELATALGIERDDLAEVRRCCMGYRAISMDAPRSRDSFPEDEVFVSPCPTDAWDISDALGRAIAGLTPRQRLILRLRYVEEWTQARIGRRIGVSQMQVSRLLSSMIEQLRRDLDLDSSVIDHPA